MNRHRFDWRYGSIVLPTLILAMWTLTSTSAQGSDPSAHHSKLDRLAAKWAQRLQANDARLRAGDWDRADKEALEVIQSVIWNLDSGAENILGVAILQHALAQSGLNHPDQARWFAEAARAYYPAIGPKSVQPYGSAGEAIARWLVDPTPELFHAEAIYGPKPGDPPGGTIPVRLSGTVPQFPSSLRKRGQSFTVVIRFIVDPGGVPQFPRILDASKSVHVVTWSFLESLRDWRFAPVKKNGVPVPYWFNLTSKYLPR